MTKSNAVELFCHCATLFFHRFFNIDFELVICMQNIMQDLIDELSNDAWME